MQKFNFLLLLYIFLGYSDFSRSKSFGKKSEYDSGEQ